MTHYGKYPERKKIVINNFIVEWVSLFNYLGCDTKYIYNKDNSITNFKLYVEQYRRHSRER
jgi:hypothetical protein